MEDREASRADERHGEGGIDDAGTTPVAKQGGEGCARDQPGCHDQDDHQAGCTSCHTLKDAGATGTVGPNLDQAKPPKSLVVDRVTNGKGVMPSFKGQLTPAHIAAVAAYVSTVAGR